MANPGQIQIKQAANMKKALEHKHGRQQLGTTFCRIDPPHAQFPSFYVMAHPGCRCSFHRMGSGLRLDPTARSGERGPYGDGPADYRGQGPGGCAGEPRPGASAFFFGDRLVNFVRSQRVSVCDDLFLHIQRTKSLLRGLPISIDIGYICGISLDCGESHLLTMFIFFAHAFHRRFSRCLSC